MVTLSGGAAIGIRAEARIRKWERRTPLTPSDVARLVQKGVTVHVESSRKRIFSDGEYERVGAKIVKKLGADVKLQLAVKEIPAEKYLPGVTYVNFAHFAKGQEHNLPTLHAVLRSGATQIDYEYMTDEKGRRVVAFGYFAGQAGITDGLALYGQVCKRLGISPNFFADVHQTYYYQRPRGPKHLTGEAAIKNQMREIGNRIKRYGSPTGPLIIGCLGYGRVIQGVLSILRGMKVEELTPQELLKKKKDGSLSDKKVYVVVFKEKDTVRLKKKDPGRRRFSMKHYLNNPKLYTSALDEYLPHLNILVNGVFWKIDQPQLVTQEALRKVAEQRRRSKNPFIVVDISCDLNGPLACTTRASTIDQPFYYYNPVSGKVSRRYSSRAIPVYAVDNAPCQLAREASEYFSKNLFKYVRQMAIAANDPDGLKLRSLPLEVQRAVIIHNHNLTWRFKNIPR